MRKNRKTNKLLTIVSAIMLMLIPVIAINLTSQSLDIRNWAANPETAPKTGCYIKLLDINEDSIPLNTRIHGTVEIDKDIIPEDITNIIVMNNRNEVLFTSTENTGRYLFTFIPKVKGDINFFGSAKTKDHSYTCVYIDNTKLPSVIAENIAPEFVSNPYVNAVPGNNLTIGEKYKYRLIATDREKDNITALFYKSANADWITYRTDIAGTSGNLEVLIGGTPSKAGSYLFGMTIHDGYGKHVVSQNWTVNVSSQDVQIPNITDVKASFDNEDKQIHISWNVSSINAIDHQEIYITDTPPKTDSLISL
jgi:hypothetical protein